MGPLCRGSLDVFRTCVSFWPLQQRLHCAELSRQWRDAARDEQTWAELDVPVELQGILAPLLDRHRGHVRRLRAFTRTWRFKGIPKELWQCAKLCHLALHDLAGSSHLKSEHGLELPSLVTLELTFAPYFTLNDYS